MSTQPAMVEHEKRLERGLKRRFKVPSVREIAAIGYDRDVVDGPNKQAIEEERRFFQSKGHDGYATHEVLERHGRDRFTVLTVPAGRRTN